MSTAPLKWWELVKTHYGTLSNFEDKFSVGYVRDQIEKERQNNKELLNIEKDYPGALNSDQLIHIQEKDKQLQSLDQELMQWQLARNSSEQQASANETT